jgi:hypothetical protein
MKNATLLSIQASTISIMPYSACKDNKNNIIIDI